MVYCSNLMAPDDEELLRYIFDEGPLNEERKRHLEQCPICQQRILDYSRTHKMLLSALYRSTCPSAMQLTLYCANELPANEIFAIDEHLRECPLCMDEVSTLREEIAHFTPFPELELSPLQQVVAQVLRRLVAQPIIQQPQMVLRQDSSATGWPRQYQAESFNLSFQLSRPHHDKMKLIGFFDGAPMEQLEALEGVVAELYYAPTSHTSEEGQSNQPGEEPVMSITVDDLGNLTFAPVSPGNYLVIIHVPGIELVVEGLNIS